MSILKKLSLATAGAVLIVLGINKTAQAGVLTFDDVTSSNQATIPNGYRGFDWPNFLVIRDSSHPNSGYSNGNVSGSYRGTKIIETENRNKPVMHIIKGI